MIKLKDFSAKLHKYFSKTFGVVNLNARALIHIHTNKHTHMSCVRQMLNAWYAAVRLPYIRRTYSGIFV